MPVEILPFDGSPGAYRRRVALLKEAQPEEPWSLEGEREADALDRGEGRPVIACFATVGGEPQGFARVQADPDVPVDGRRRLWVAVAHAARRCGLGTGLLRAAGALAAGRGATELHASTSLAEPDGLAFALARGFREVETEVELHLDLGGFEPARSAGPVRVESLADLRRTHPDWFERYYRLHTAVEASVPWGLGYTAPDRAAFRRRHVEAVEALAQGTRIALVDGEWVGLCELRRCGDDRTTVYQELTGVLSTRRREGIGSALVAGAAGWARGRGYRRMLTSTSTANAAMQAVARRLGYSTAGRWSHLLGSLREGGVPSGREVPT